MSSNLKCQLTGESVVSTDWGLHDRLVTGRVTLGGARLWAGLMGSDGAGLTGSEAAAFSNSCRKRDFFGEVTLLPSTPSYRHFLSSAACSRPCHTYTG